MNALRSRRIALTLTALAVVAVPSAAVAGDAHRDNTQSAKHAIQGGKARNVILLIGDGMGDSEITIARNYQVGADGRLAMDKLPLTGAYTTYAVHKDRPTIPDYVTDSAASGTGWATGHKTYNGAISVTPDGKPKPTILEKAKAAGFRTGNVTTAELEDATPAVLVSHVVSRDCKGPDAMATCAVNDKVNGGAGSIAEQLVETKADVTLGGGKAYFDQKVKAGKYSGLTVLQQAQVNGYQIVTDTTGLAGLPANPKGPVLGAFAPNNMDLEWVGPKPTRTGTPATRCAVNTARNAAQPHLVDMAGKALQILDRQTRDSRKGFFLQIEGASIDKQDHAANPCGQIGETVAFDAAVKKALDYQKSHPDTLVVVTADHGHTSQIVEAATLGYTATLTTNEGGELTISYATADITGSQQHTGTEVRIAAGGPQASNVLGVTNQTDLNYTMRRALGVS
ncbi:alkaline phosphatase [Actinoplanes sp. NPDC049265]|uniref:alkaline phosphatase n=1 Tax=Actinoplanes sp. NPDC049265 TaxID=3363902 RepID=UPI00371F40F0